MGRTINKIENTQTPKQLAEIAEKQIVELIGKSDMNVETGKMVLRLLDHYGNAKQLQGYAACKDKVFEKSLLEHAANGHVLTDDHIAYVTGNIS